jgi:hypothetical protein
VEFLTEKQGLSRVLKMPNSLPKVKLWFPALPISDGLPTIACSMVSLPKWDRLFLMAVVAREYSLPLIVNVPNATQIIKTGDFLAINGNTGEMRILDEAEAERYR